MSFVLRAARAGDLPALYQMAKSTGGGFTNLPPDRPTLKAKLARTEASFSRDEETLADDLFLFVLEDTASAKVRGTCQIFSRIGSRWPFYSYRISTFTQYSKELDRTIRAETLVLSTDLDGASEVGGLFLLAGERAAGTGALLARSRYLFMAMHRARFADRTIAELRGAHDETGGSAFWDGLAGRFFGMSFREADDFNAVHGNQFIADLMPKHPIYTALLPETALAVIGKPHQSGRAAQRMLENEGFRYECYVDVFDGGPTMTAPTDGIATIKAARTAEIVGLSDEGEDCLVAHGHLGAFRASCGRIAATTTGVKLNPGAAEALGISVGDSVTYVPR
ncbi:arginine N-succinyltransferase [Novosphingobium sp. PS1R-30]|uniref:Arginine N-succinyltransferase n=1 Tax=Novosphingobium anseongense TaxID=3133436 RepID=A0ABU8RPY7_9SPHN